MEFEKYDFEGALEQGFKALFDTKGLSLRVPDDMDEGELPDECITLEVNVGGPISDEHLNSEGVYDNYGGSFEVTVKSNRIAGDKVKRNTSAISDFYVVSGAGTLAVNGMYVRNGNSADGNPAYTRYIDGVATYNLYSIANLAWAITDQAIDIPSNNSYSIFPSGGAGTSPPQQRFNDSLTAGDFLNPAPIVGQIQVRNRHNELVARTRKVLEEIDSTALSTHWPVALSPTKIKPTGTERENDNLSKMTTLSYELQFRIT